MRAVSVSNMGGRKSNDERIGYVDIDGLRCFVLCSGFGEQSMGSAAAEIICTGICDAFKESPNLSEDALRRYMEKADEALGKARTENKNEFDMKAVAAVLITDGEKAVWCNVGDVRLYYLACSEIENITNDHSEAFTLFENGDITYDEIRKNIARSKILKACHGETLLEVEIYDMTDISDGDAFLICSDGFWEYVSEDDIEDTVRNSSSPKEWLEAMLEILHKNEIEENDNYSAVAIMVP